ncbi:MAG: ECF-type sigma factor [Pseudomonadota bacterium]
MALASYNDNDRALAERIIAENYDTLIDIARAKRRRADLGDTLQTSDLLHECWLKLDGKRQWNSEEHFIRAAVLAMRHVIIDHLRRRKADKRGGGSKAETLDEERAFPEFSETPEQLLQIGQMMEKLEASNPRWMRIVDARYFAGMTEDEAAGALNISARTVRREWRNAREWIGEQLGVAT